jgi:hypothetical protein
MMAAANDLEYERAAELRDQIKRLEMRALGLDSGSGGAVRATGNGGSSAARAGAERGKPAAGLKGRKGRAASGRQIAAPSSARQGRLRLIPDEPD